MKKNILLVMLALIAATVMLAAVSCNTAQTPNDDTISPSGSDDTSDSVGGDIPDTDKNDETDESKNPDGSAAPEISGVPDESKAPAESGTAEIPGITPDKLPDGPETTPAASDTTSPVTVDTENDLEPDTFPEDTTVPIVPPTPPVTTAPIVAPSAGSLTYEEFIAMSGAEQQAYMENFDDLNAFLVWLSAAEQKYKESTTNNEIENGGTIIIPG